MHNEFTAIIEKDGDWFISYCPEVPGANGQGKTIEESKRSLAEAISLILEDRRQDALGVYRKEPCKKLLPYHEAGVPAKAITSVWLLS